MSHQAPVIVFHVPHASTNIPEDIRPSLQLSDREPALELIAMTDSFTDELFDIGPTALTVRYPVSRLVVDPERYLEDALEPMAAHGMGAVYVRTSTGGALWALPAEHERQALLDRFYAPHHRALTTAVEAALASRGSCVLVDCHSFPSGPRAHELDPMTDRPDICLGTDPFHTPAWLLDHARLVFESRGWTVAVDRPYAGTIVPATHYRSDARVASLMIEVNRGLYMHEDSGKKRTDFAAFAASFQQDLLTICTRALTTNPG